ncbi:MAG: septum formation protein Maf [Crocinitomicaceae bacterium]|jgi:septum formation protein|nr:septum formation protein Maf [Crocinitomicaceae bacterium]
MIHQNIQGKRIILASQSPRRLELVRGLELDPIIRLKDVDESYPPNIAGPAVAEYVTRKKAEAYLSELEDHDVLITGDTVVLLDNEVLGKPKSAEQARTMLDKLSNRTHTVASGIAVTTKAEGICSAVDTCEVTFAKLDLALIDHYIARYEPFDKAGGYGVQDLIGFSGVTSLNGSYFTVMGLPTHLLFNLLNNLKS